MADVLIQAQQDDVLPKEIAEASTDKDDMPPPDLPVEPIHALQLLFLPILLIYIFMSFIVAIVSQDYFLFIISILAVGILIVGRQIEKKYAKDLKQCRKIAIYVLAIEFGLYIIWRIACSVMYGGPFWLFF
jgi:hypothetical protein